ncbi:MAG: hypothetical protein IJ093_02795 [Bacilli bacterium]|nr:hypothetical protein [Bacilli bacterium]
MINTNLLLITHIADEDGITPVILAKLVYKKVDTILINPGEVDNTLKENINKYDLIHVTDLSISDSLAKEIEDNEKYRSKVKIFDHHATALPLNKYSFAKVIVETETQKESATSIYYNYLLTVSNNSILHKKVTKQLVNAVRIVDTYDFKTQSDKAALNMDYLFSILGRETYIKYFTNYLKHHQTFKYTKREKFLIKLQKDKIDSYIKRKEKELILGKIDNHKVGIIFAESNKSLLGNYLLNNHNIDFIILIDASGKISYRGKGLYDLSKFAEKHNGGGHKDASGSPIEQKVQEKFITELFSEIKLTKEEQK